MKWTEAERAVFRKLSSMGGKARAKKLTKAQRKAIASKAARTRWDACKA